MKRMIGLLGGALLIGSTHANAGDLVYQPINPSFGGSPLNGSYLLGKAQAQDTHEDPGLDSYESLSATDRLVSSLESRLISQLISDVGSGDVTQGSFESDDFIVIVDDTGGGLSLRVTDKVTGDVTSIDVGGLNFNP
ncbi:curli assembly protein CsgF [Halomonas sp. McH1-25]|uniref:curli assembly protein CsgF n=1 Tax=unclassified Halomonas TaxID=2609666 RepID=UPI001EF41964|nr:MULTISPECIES: curli assembly protein CsgF [unclassified Halomonas]MCG7600478.1 curli assembly protein CsgF [Halomonas sp. McH1-25]MCP1342923.1 curli assembly protein CsgF [Halomonas sp. FL8]MCP1359985.1 curli assembly protein CsgF [Halomonas sp. BBD45]MCP1364706.1 curli assembly protein CsgF [Halomonas sp. BBD48]